ncbi:MAG: DivIVA domain-containing protein [Eubacterium sp.]|nr:DivIVA domain-containing protein [Eubacterium sp.]MBQ8980526.1 DivIVA domain-containing protein [Eubacterium sp.]MBR1532549.1 DivIVA domain-containing protein [Eubacterium sp.]MBR2278300.1 DivIVA domain-containing protein [Eubacterium sp.]
MADDVIKREDIIGAGNKSYDFDKVLRGYDPKQVDEVLSNLQKANKSATEIFDQRIVDLKNRNEMLTYELDQAKQEADRMRNLFNQCKEERDALSTKLAKADRKVVVPADNTEEVKALEEKLQKALTKNRLLQDDNKKLEDQNRDLQRDVAHLTKKVDKNRNKINDLEGQVESGMTDDDSKKFSEIAQVYESAIDKAEDLIYRLQTEFSLAHSKAEDIKK